MHKIIFKIEPVPASRPRVTQFGTYYSERYDQFRKDMAKLLAGKQTLYPEPLHLSVIFYMPIPKSFSEKKKKEMNGTYCVSNMDLDNLEKALYDSMNGVVYLDDKQIVHHNVMKVWSIEPRIEVIIQRI